MVKNRQAVAVGMIVDKNGRLLISKRPPHKSKGGFWEFPGGKVEPEETAEEALVRELQEELGIVALKYHPLMIYPYDYPEYNVLLEVFVVNHFEGEAKGNEGQEIKWISMDQISDYSFLEANSQIIEFFLLNSTQK